MNVIAVVVMKLLVAAPPATCEVRGTVHYLRDVSMVVPGGKPFAATLEDLRVVARFDAGKRVTVTGDGALELVATIARADLEVHARETTTIAGLMTLGTSMMLRVDKTIGDVAQVRTRTFGGIDVGPFPLRCDALTVDAAAFGQNPRVLASDATPAYVKRGRGVLRSEPNGGAALTFTAAEAFDRGEEHDGWTQVSARWADGSTLSGWVSGARSTPGKPASDPGTRDAATCPAVGVPRDVYYGPATLAAGAEIVDAATKGHAWARTRAAMNVFVRGNRGMVQIVELPGVTACDLPAYVSADELVFPTTP